MRRIWGLLAVLLLFGLTSCGESSPVIHNGRELDEEELAALLRVDETGGETAVQTVDAKPIDTNEIVPIEFRVYWTKGGSVWHADNSCRHLLSSEGECFFGSESDAIAAGKKRLCSVCAKKGE